MNKNRRFSDDELRAIRDRVSIPSLLPADALRPCGDQLRGRCPLTDHEDRNPSFYVSLRKRRFYCHGCKRGGDVIQLYRLLYDASFPDAVRELQTRAGTLPSAAERYPESQPSPLTSPILSPAHRALLEEVASRYREAAIEEPAMLRYLEGRGFSSEHGVGLGFAPATGIGLTNETGARRQMLLDLGLLDERDGRRFERLRNAIVFAVADLAGGVHGFAGRRISGEPRYLNTRFSKRLFPLGLFEAREAVLESREVVLVEGPFDWLAMRAMGHENVLALLGSKLHPETESLWQRLESKPPLWSLIATWRGELEPNMRSRNCYKSESSQA